MADNKEAKRARARGIAAEFAERGDATGWFEACYKEASGDNEKILRADLEPNRFSQWPAGGKRGKKRAVQPNSVGPAGLTAKIAVLFVFRLAYL